jgi:hypothetical protein
VSVLAVVLEHVFCRPPFETCLLLGERSQILWGHAVDEHVASKVGKLDTAITPSTESEPVVEIGGDTKTVDFLEIVAELIT